MHVGVRRVILYYISQLKANGWNVEIGMPKSGKIYSGQLHFSKDEQNTSFMPEPYWSSNSNPAISVERISQNSEKISVKWSENIVNPDGYDVNVVTAPWICTLGVPPMPRVVGIVYDLVPNLLASGCLRFPNYINIYDFSQQHDLGFRYYLANADRVICISDSTRNDFLNLYRTAHKLQSIITDIPFEYDCDIPVANLDTQTVLLVNVLDWRKNLKTIEQVLLNTNKKTRFKLRVVGKERIDIKDALKFFTKMADLGIDVEWHRDVDDNVLKHQYSQASILLFPSIYEGLGLPILEAQANGVPVITSNGSSCAEINLNSDLCFESNDVDAMAESLTNILLGKANVMSGNNLKASLDRFLLPKQNPVKAFSL